MNNKIETRIGIAEQSKAGLVVDGVMLMNLSLDDQEKYVGKNICVEGEIDYDHPWKTDNDEIQRQGFTMPAMITIKSIKNLD